MTKMTNEKALRVIAERLSVIDQSTYDLFDPELVASEIIDELHNAGFQLFNSNVNNFDNMQIDCIQLSEKDCLTDIISYDYDFNNIQILDLNGKLIEIDLDKPSDA